MHQAFSRRRFMLSLGMLGVLPARVLALEATESDAAPVLIGAAWRGPKADDTYPVVGAATFKLNDFARARAAAEDVARELGG